MNRQPDPAWAMQTLSVGSDANGIVQITMSKPTFDEVMVSELAETFKALRSDPAVRAIVLTGQGEVFSTGADLPRRERPSQARAEWSVEAARDFAQMLWLVDSCAKPTIARVHGVASGSGVGLLCACDFAVASGDSSFAVAETGIGRVPSVIRPYLVNAVGRVRAERLASSDTPIDAHEARSIGLIQAVVATSELDAATKALGSIFHNAPSAPRKLKSLISKDSCRCQR